MDVDRDRSRGADGHGGQGVRTQVPGASVGEDRAILLGCTMMAFSVLMFFVVGITVIKPFVNRYTRECCHVSRLSYKCIPSLKACSPRVCVGDSSGWDDGNASCVLQKSEILEEWVDCRGVSTVPCLKATVTVYFNGSTEEAVLHLNEDSVLLATECFYMPKCQMDRKALQDQVQKVNSSLDSLLGNNTACLTDQTRYPNHAILHRKYTLQMVLFALLWPCILLGGGALLVGLVKLTQCLAHLSTEVISEAAGGRLTSRYTQGKLYRLLRRSSAQSPS
ncbi:calcium-activated potassium channel subunit beta-3 isoform X3 [Oreochromis aureus]|uniref:calcium-activated potassium channel subunit beta-3 isoform X3 n=1 Tax=Oreochromis aureus TaxID=47969 RepID=UPI0019536777|nr:calcium-activated potassium channel subunit beta-3 isoform X3 [Oreochromis aureus]